MMMKWGLLVMILVNMLIEDHHPVVLHCEC